jgi:uncharacterized protein (DUF169 family)
MMEAQELDQRLWYYVRPQSFPLGIRMVKRGEAFPGKARRPRADMGIQVAICQAVGMARRYGWTLAVGYEDIACPLTYIPFGFSREVSFSAEGHACAGIYTDSPEAGARSEALVPRLEYGRYRGLVVGPLARIDFQPDLFVVYGNSAQVMRLVQGALYSRGGALSSLSTGRIDCAEIVIRTFQEGRPQFILPCSGDRIFGLTADDEMVFSAPFSWAEEIVKGLEGTHKGGIRYPIPVYMRFQPSFPPQYEELRSAVRAAGEPLVGEGPDSEAPSAGGPGDAKVGKV